jgi:methionyl-tRNA synthetase
MSKSKGNAIDPNKAVAAVGTDAFRYFLLREIPFGSDGDFSQAALLTRVNSELANDYGNLLNRTLGMLKKYRGSMLPEPVRPGDATWGELETHLLSVVTEARETLLREMSAYRFHEALRAIWTAVSAGNKYVDSAAPWKLAKGGEDDAATLDCVLYTLMELLRTIGVWTLPFLPSKSETLLNSINAPDTARSFESTDPQLWGQLKGGVDVVNALSLFPRIEGPLELTRRPQTKTSDAQTDVSSTQDQPAKKQKQKQKQTTRAKAEATDASSEIIEFDDFVKLQLRVAVITHAEVHPNADRLLKLTVDAGEETPRTVCAGIAEAYQPGELIGRRVTLLANLKPRKIRGVVSQGMLLAAGEGAGVRLIEVPEGPAPGEPVS